VTLLFEPGEVVESKRLRLSHLTIEALESMESWLPTYALDPDWSLDDLRRVTARGQGILISDADDEPIGVAVAFNDSPIPGAACIPLVAIAPQRRFVGLGGEAGLALEKQIRARWGVERVYAPLPDWRGLALYFWIRCGFRPLQTPDAPWPLAGLSDEAKRGIWLLRDSP
jgi:hypothetical protein